MHEKLSDANRVASVSVSTVASGIILFTTLKNVTAVESSYAWMILIVSLTMFVRRPDGLYTRFKMQ